MTPTDRAATLALAKQRRITLADVADAPHSCRMAPMSADLNSPIMLEDTDPPPGKVFLTTLLRLVMDGELAIASHDPLEWCLVEKKK